MIIIAIIIECIKQSLIKVIQFIKKRKQTKNILFFLILVIYKLLAKLIVLFKNLAFLLKMSN